MTTQRARKMVLTDEQRVRVVAGRIRFARLVIAAVALAFVGTGIAFLLLPARHDVILKSALGLFFVVLGTGTGFFAWRGDWTPPDKERWERQRITQAAPPRWLPRRRAIISSWGCQGWLV